MMTLSSFTVLSQHSRLFGLIFSPLEKDVLKKNFHHFKDSPETKPNLKTE